MITHTETDLDIIIITGEYYDDHPLSPAGVLARVLDAKGYRVGIIEKPVNDADYTKLGAPTLCFCVTSGSIDSMLNNYTALKRKRSADNHSSASEMPDRAVIFYCNKIRALHHKKPPIIIGGVEASLRRFAHYDYWSNKVRRSILFDSRADILVYGNGEKQVIEIARRLHEKKEITGIAGTCIIMTKRETCRERLSFFSPLPSFEEVIRNKTAFCRMQLAFSNNKNLAQKCGTSYLLQYKYPHYTSENLDWVFSLNYSRNLHPKSLLKMAQFSVVTHRGCLGKCSFCSLALHQGDRIISRSEKSIINEITRITHHPDFKGYIDDLGGPSANMYALDCEKDCGQDCLPCPVITKNKTGNDQLIRLLRTARTVKGVKKIFIRSGIRYDLALHQRNYLQEISRYHISGCLKIAPEHFSQKVLHLMNKDNSRFHEFLKVFRSLNKHKKQQLRYYFMIGHPGDNQEEVRRLRQLTSSLNNVEQFQLFTPTPMTRSTCIYWTELNPSTLTKVKAVKDFKGKKELIKTMLVHQRT